MRKHVSASGSLLRPREDVESTCNSERFPTLAKMVVFLARSNTGYGAIQGTGQANRIPLARLSRRPGCVEAVSRSETVYFSLERRLAGQILIT